MKRKATVLTVLVFISFFLSSCYTYSITIGKGPQTGVELRKMNHYLLYGLAPVGTSNVKEMVGDAENYQIVIQHTFVDGLISAITLGLYTPTTTIVKK
ncbi:MAG: Bor family protein [Chitinophagales bacterium]|nr:Bor family protein [Chitinophagales bacterium]MDW8394375.1 Bor family protein [Chitinophagales bacterium]